MVRRLCAGQPSYERISVDKKSRPAWRGGFAFLVQRHPINQLRSKRENCMEKVPRPWVADRSDVE